VGIDEREEILKVLSGAIIRETNAFNFYYKGSENENMPAGARGLLARLAEEERVHRQLLVNEYKSIEKGWNGDEGEEGGTALSYKIPSRPSFTPLELSERLEAIALTMPSRLVGGDSVFSRVIRDHGGNATGTLLLLYDAMGHSMKTTEINGFAAKAVGEYVDSVSLSKMEAEMLSPRKIVTVLNEKLAERYEGEGIFLTVLCVLFDCGAETLTYTCAGHEPPFLVDGSGKASSLLQTQLIAGIDPAFHYREHSMPFDRGDIFCVFSDGIVEAENSDEAIYGRGGISRILEENRDGSPAEIVAAVLEGLKAHLGGRPLRDEVSIILVKAKGE
jgi:serine phosphatase RsbU (regulator of sigma subunit)